MTAAAERGSGHHDRTDAYVKSVVDSAPPLTAAKRDRLAILLRNPAPEPALAERREAS
jgi:hypothetical protein